MLRASSSEKKDVIAEYDLDRKTPYFCPACGWSVIYKCGKFKIPHFAHKPNSECTFGRGESKRHLEIKFRLYKWLKSLGHDVTVEQRLGRHITDVYAKVNGQRICFEIQLSPIDIDEIDSRMAEYSRYSAATVWVLCGEKMKLSTTQVKKTWLYMQRLQFGITYIWKDNRLNVIRFSPFYRWIEPSEFSEHAGFWLAYKQTKLITRSSIYSDDLLSKIKCSLNTINNSLVMNLKREHIFWKKEDESEPKD